MDFSFVEKSNYELASASAYVAMLADRRIDGKAASKRFVSSAPNLPLIWPQPAELGN
jgi:hypothetical protein